MSELVQIITAGDPQLRDSSLDAFCRESSLQELLAECRALDQLRSENENLYQRVRALFFLYAIHRFHLPLRQGFKVGGHVPYDGYTNLLRRRFEEAINIFLGARLYYSQSTTILGGKVDAYLPTYLEVPIHLPYLYSDSAFDTQY